MADLSRLREDLEFVRASVKDAPVGAPPAVYFLWGALVLVGFVLHDVALDWVPSYWTVAGPMGGLLSAYFGWRHQQRSGSLDASRGIRYALHWGALLAAVFLATFMVRQRVVAAEAFGPVVLLLVAQAYFHAGLHLDKPLRWVGLMMVAAYLVVLSMSAYVWTVAGVVVSAALLISGVRASRGGAVAA
jgi:hypothetical protein